jgi:hypothetical protein
LEERTNFEASEARAKCLEKEIMRLKEENCLIKQRLLSATEVMKMSVVEDARE